ncbi:MAG: DinB family protein [Ekhidna sp.]
MKEVKISTELSKLFKRDLAKLEYEITEYSKEDGLWIVKGDISNSAGNLTLHLCGNLQHFIGAVLGKSDYERNRPFEFEGKVTLSELQEEIKQTTIVVTKYLDSVNEKEWENEFPLQPFAYPMSISEFIFHLYGHLNYHLGQINYHRRLLNLG